MSFISCTSKPEVAEDMFLIKGNIKNVADSAVILLFEPTEMEHPN